MWTGIIVGKGDVWTMELNELKNFHSKNIIYVSLRINVSIKQVLLPPIIPTQTKTETPPKWSRSLTHALANALPDGDYLSHVLQPISSVGRAYDS